MDEVMIKIDKVSKEYKLGQIGGTTLRDELQRRRAKRRGLEDPTRKIGARQYQDGETFLALDDVSFTVHRGERVGIIGHNGAGKSTLLKLLCRVTAPTDGFIGLNGRVASMLEVGTGFHPELTGRENIYMNGAILGMTKKEIDRKIEDIIEFSEVRQFIDTPVKRYSSGMYVKLAFSVAAHLDSEIMIMDEVLAVGDMAFQKKCLDKMSDVSQSQGRTILYVSHNMNTIRQLCNRVIVLDHGHVIFDGGVEEGIENYINTNAKHLLVSYDLRNKKRHAGELGSKLFINRVELPDREVARYFKGEKMKLNIEWQAKERLEAIQFSVGLRAGYGNNIGLMSMDTSILPEVKKVFQTKLSVDISCLEAGYYTMEIIAHEQGCLGIRSLDKADELSFEIVENDQSEYVWHREWWGCVHLNCVDLILNQNLKQ